MADDEIIFTTTTEYYNASLENTTDFLNATTNTTVTEEISWTYSIGIPIITIFCIISMTVNVRVLICVRWLQGPLSNTLFISLSLAAADAFSSALLFIGFVVNSYTARVWKYEFPSCIVLFLEAVRLGAIITTVMHLLFLAVNHYLGIVRPLHYPNLMTRKLTKGMLIFLWILPPVFFLISFASIKNDGFQHQKCYATFLRHFEFRIIFTMFLLIPLITMTFIYTHILVIVRKKQNEWQYLAERGTSCKHRGGNRSTLTETTKRRPHQQHSHHGHYGIGTENQRNHQRMQRNVKAVHTTLLILGSFVAGLLPAITMYLLVCDNCYYEFSKANSYILPTLYWFVNLLLVIKPLANPIIYAARMQEIKEATRRMRTALCHDRGKCRFCIPLLPICCLCCGFNWSRNLGRNRNTEGTGGGIFGHRWVRGTGYDSRTDSQQLYFSGSSWRAATPRTAVCRLVSNGNTLHLTTTGNNTGNNSTMTFTSETGQNLRKKTLNNGDNTTVL